MSRGGSFLKGVAKWVLVPLLLIGAGYVLGEHLAKSSRAPTVAPPMADPAGNTVAQPPDPAPTKANDPVLSPSLRPGATTRPGPTLEVSATRTTPLPPRHHRRHKPKSAIPPVASNAKPTAPSQTPARDNSSAAADTPVLEKPTVHKSKKNPDSDE